MIAMDSEFPLRLGLRQTLVEAGDRSEKLGQRPGLEAGKVGSPWAAGSWEAISLGFPSHRKLSWNAWNESLQFSPRSPRLPAA